MSIKEIAEVFMNLKIPENFGGNMENDDYDWLYAWCEETVNKHLTIPHFYVHGVSKLVFVLKEQDWVIKIPFNGYYSNVLDDETCEYGKEEEEYWTFFQYAAENGWDYCNVELEKYESVQSRGLECFFADTRYLCSDKNNYPIYIQEKVIPCSDDKEKRTPSKKSLELVKDKHYFNDEWVAIAIDFYGEHKVKQFLDYIENIDPIISDDLHTGNYGYRPDGSPCLLDFSGWSEDW